MQPTTPQKPADPLLVLNMVWIMLMGSVGMLGFQITQLSSRWPPISGNILEACPLPLLLAAIAAAAASFIVPNLLTNAKMKNAKDIPGTTAQRVRAILFISYIIRFALTDSIAILGFLMAMMTKDIRLFYAGAGFSLVLYLLAKPNRELFKKMEQDLALRGL